MEEGQFTNYEEELHGNQGSRDELDPVIALHDAEWMGLEPFINWSTDHGSQYPKERVADCTDELALELDSMNMSLEPNDSAARRIEQPVQASMTLDINVESKNCEFLEIQAASNILKAAFKEIMTIAFKAKTWVVGTPALGSIDELLPMFRSLPPSGTRVECSIESAIVPITPTSFVSIMMDVDKWSSLLSHIVHRGSAHLPTAILRQLSAESPDRVVKDMKMVNAEFQLPTPSVPTRKYCFLRCQIEIIRNIWAIIDVSDNYFHHTPDSALEQKNCRRPSGVIIRGCGPCDAYSEVIWIENVEVHDCLAQDNIYSNIVNSNLAFCAKRWVNTLSQKLKRSERGFIDLLKKVDWRATANLLRLTDFMEVVYLECINEVPNESKWAILSEQGARILRDMTVNHVDALGSNNYIALTSFRVQAKPLSVFHFLVKKNMEFQWPSILNLKEPEEEMKLISQDDSCCITLHKKVVLQNELTECYEYLLEEASMDEFCSFVISSRMAQSDVHDALFFGMQQNDTLKPSGFAIMPDGSGGLQSDASLVTIVMQQVVDVPETGDVIKAMNSLISAIVKEITEAVMGGGDPMN